MVSCRHSLPPPLSLGPVILSENAADTGTVNSGIPTDFWNGPCAHLHLAVLSLCAMLQIMEVYLLLLLVTPLYTAKMRDTVIFASLPPYYFIIDTVNVNLYEDITFLASNPVLFHNNTFLIHKSLV